MPRVIEKKATVQSYIGLRSCSLCGKSFDPEEQFRVVEEDGPFDNDWYAVCKECVQKPIYAKFIASNCSLKVINQ